ncbi:MAG: polysaccharide deacetylase family protein [Chloroflexota bacterium]
MQKQRWKDVAFNIAEQSGAISFFQYLGQKIRQHLYVLVYHRVDEYENRPWLDPELISAEPAQFNSQMRLVAEKYHPVSAEDVLNAIKGEQPLPPNSVLVTVDDGYRDFSEVIFPITSQYGIKPVLFIPTAYVGRGPFWWDKLFIAVSNYPGPEISTPLGSFSIRSLAEKKQATRHLTQEVKKLPFEQGMQIVDALYHDFVPRNSDDTRSILTWDELRVLARSGVTIAAHTHTHALLSRIPLEQASQEIRTSRETIHRELGQSLPIFAFPDGKPEFFTAEHVDLLRDLGFKFAVTTVEGSASLSNERLLCFPRIGVWPGLSLSAFHYHLTPVFRRFEQNPAY